MLLLMLLLLVGLAAVGFPIPDVVIVDVGFVLVFLE